MERVDCFILFVVVGLLSFWVDIYVVSSISFAVSKHWKGKKYLVEKSMIMTQTENKTRIQSMYVIEEATTITRKKHL